MLPLKFTVFSFEAIIRELNANVYEWVFFDHQKNVDAIRPGGSHLIVYAVSSGRYVLKHAVKHLVKNEVCKHNVKPFVKLGK